MGGLLKPALARLRRGHPLAQGLIIAYTFDDDTTNANAYRQNTIERASFGRALTTSAGAPVWQGGPAGEALYLSSTGYLDTQISTQLEGLGRFSIACRVYIKSVQAGAFCSKNGNTGMNFQRFTDNATYFGVNGTTNRAITAVNAVPINTWGTVVGTYDGNTMTIYWEGVSVASSARGATTIPVDGTHLLLGQSGGGTEDCVYDYFYFWNRSLIKDEVSSLLFDPFALVRSWQLIRRGAPPVFTPTGIERTKWAMPHTRIVKSGPHHSVRG